MGPGRRGVYVDAKRGDGTPDFFRCGLCYHPPRVDGGSGVGGASPRNCQAKADGHRGGHGKGTFIYHSLRP